MEAAPAGRTENWHWTPQPVHCSIVAAAHPRVTPLMVSLLSSSHRWRKPGSSAAATYAAPMSCRCRSGRHLRAVCWHAAGATFTSRAVAFVCRCGPAEVVDRTIQCLQLLCMSFSGALAGLAAYGDSDSEDSGSDESPGNSSVSQPGCSGAGAAGAAASKPSHVAEDVPAQQGQAKM